MERFFLGKQDRKKDSGGPRQSASVSRGGMTVAQSIVGFSTDGGRPLDDFYITPPEATRALLAVENFGPRIWEPACGDGAMSEVLIAAGYDVVSSDLGDYGYGDPGVDFLTAPIPPEATALSSCGFRLTALRWSSRDIPTPR